MFLHDRQCFRLPWPLVLCRRSWPCIYLLSSQAEVTHLWLSWHTISYRHSAKDTAKMTWKTHAAIICAILNWMNYLVKGNKGCYKIAAAKGILHTLMENALHVKTVLCHKNPACVKSLFFFPSNEKKRNIFKTGLKTKASLLNRSNTTTFLFSFCVALFAPIKHKYNLLQNQRKLTSCFSALMDRETEKIFPSTNVSWQGLWYVQIGNANTTFWASAPQYSLLGSPLAATKVAAPLSGLYTQQKPTLCHTQTGKKTTIR